MSKKTPAAAQPPADPVRPAPDAPEDMTAALSAGDTAPDTTPDNPDSGRADNSGDAKDLGADTASAKADPVAPNAKAPAPTPDIDDEEAILVARVAELGDPHTRVMVAAARLTKAREEQFERSIALELAVNAATDTLRNVQAQAQIDKEELRLSRLRLDQLATARADLEKDMAATAAGTKSKDAATQ